MGKVIEVAFAAKYNTVTCIGPTRSNYVNG